MMKSANLTSEESFLWACARQWRQPAMPALSPTLNWETVVTIALQNRMQTLLQQTLSQLQIALPANAQKRLNEGMALFAERVKSQSASLLDYLQLAQNAGISTIVMKGLSISVNVYGEIGMRPGFDIDILVRRDQVYNCIALMEKQMGFGRFWPGYLQDSYYDRHHLHHERSDAERVTWYEIHWAFDHPLTLFTIDYDAILERAVPGQLLGAPVWEFDLADMILGLVVHLVKHAVYLPAVLDNPQLPRIILADGKLMYFLDVAELIKCRHAGLDWQTLINRAKEWGTAGQLGAVLHVCQQLYHAPIPDWVLAALPIPPSGPLTQQLMNAMVKGELARYHGQPQSRLAAFLTKADHGFILRPIRLLDLWHYVWPNNDYLQRRYGKTHLFCRLSHTAKAGLGYAQTALESLYYYAEWIWRIKIKRNETGLL